MLVIACVKLLLCLGLVGCATADDGAIAPFLEATKADGGGKAPKLHARDDHGLDVDEPSDLAFLDGKLFAVSDRHSKIYEITTTGDVADALDVAAQDLEALAAVGGGTFAIADERDDKIWFVDPHGERLHAFEIAGVDDGNSGIEGLAFDERGHLFVAKEKDPARIYELDAEGRELARTNIDVEDLSALAWHGGQLYALSDAEHALYRLDTDLTAIAAWRLPVAHPEGIAFDGSTLYVVSDSDERIYEFELTDD